jgi:hypothetical protein
MPNFKMTGNTLIILILILSACQENKVKDLKTEVSEIIVYKNDSLPSFSITYSTIENFENAKAKYKVKFIQDTLRIIKKNGVTEIPLERPHYPPSVIFKDKKVNGDDTEGSEYSYLGNFPSISKSLVSGNFWEHYECYLIDNKTGDKTTIWNDPFLSPSSKYLANISLPFGMDGIPNGIQVWKLDTSNRNNLIKYLELDQQIWAPDDFVWDTDNSIILKVVSVDKYLTGNGQPNENEFYYIKMRIN